MLINQFNGGLNTRQAPQMLGLNQAVVYENIDNYLGTLTPAKGDVDVSELPVNSFPTWFEAGNRWVNGLTGAYEPRVELNRRLYAATVTGLFVHEAAVIGQRAAGMPKPNSAPSVTIQTGPGRVASAKLTPAASVSATALPQGSYSYLLLNKNALGYSAGLSVKVDAFGRSTITANDYYWDRQEDIRLQDFEQVVGSDVGTKQTITIGPVAAVIEAAFGLDVFRVFNGKHYKVGTLTAYTDTIVDDTFDISANEELVANEFTPLKGTYQYVITHLNEQGIESVPSEVSVEAKVLEGGQITLGLAQNFFTNGKTRIYRVGGNITKFTLVEEVIGTTATYIDNKSDLELDGRVLTSQEYGVAPAGMTSLITAYGMLFGADGNNLRYTNPGEPEYWPAAYSIPFPLKITGLAAVSNGVLVMTSSSTYIMTGSGPLTLSRQLLRSDQGCVDVRSIQNFLGNAIWVSQDGICVSSGSSVEVISKNALGKLTLPGVRSSALFNETYYVIYDTNKTLAVDFSFGAAVFKSFNFGRPGVLSFFQDKTSLYLYNIGKYKLFEGSANLTMKYKSPRFIEGRATENKTYKKVYFYVKGAVQLSIYINDVLVASKSTAADTEDTIELLVPQELQRGFFIQFAVEGPGEVYEIEYIAVGRERG
jgi:hypothetical protein